MGSCHSKSIKSSLRETKQLMKWCKKNGISSTDATILINHYLSLAHMEVSEATKVEREKATLARLKEQRKLVKTQMKKDLETLKLELQIEKEAAKRKSNHSEAAVDESSVDVYEEHSSVVTLVHESVEDSRETYSSTVVIEEITIPRTPRPSTVGVFPDSNIQSKRVLEEVQEKLNEAIEEEEDEQVHVDPTISHRSSIFVEKWIEQKEEEIKKSLRNDEEEMEPIRVGTSPGPPTPHLVVD